MSNVPEDYDPSELVPTDAVSLEELRENQEELEEAFEEVDQAGDLEE